MLFDVRIRTTSFRRNADGTANHGNNAIEIASHLRELARMVEAEADRFSPGISFGSGPKILHDSGAVMPVASAAYYGMDER